jgi:lysophospholipase L1-like esterase
VAAIGALTRTRLARLLLLAGVVAVTLLILEGLVRVAAPRAVMVPWQDDIHGVTAPKLEVAGRFAIRGRFDTSVTIHDRFRGRRPIVLQPSSGVTRIAVLGDSATFGWGVEDDEAYPAVLEQQLSAKGGPSHNGGAVEVINAGVIGTGTGEQALWYDLWVKQYAPSIVVLSVFPNDVDDDSRGGFFELDAAGAAHPRPLDVLERGLETVRRTRAIANSIPGFDWLSEHSELFTWVRQGPTEFFTARHARAVGADEGAMQRRASLWPEELARLCGEIRWLRDRVAPGRLALVFLPSAEAFDRARAGSADVAGRSAQIVAALHALATHDGMPFLDVQQAIGERPDAVSLFFKDDPHANAAGNRAFAEVVASFLIREDVVMR